MIPDQELQRQLDIVKTKVFMGNNRAFLGSLMCSQEFIWDESIPTCCWDGKAIRFNAQFFLSRPPETRITCLVHELWHIARMYFVRRGDRDNRYWNYACDIRINNDLENEGYSFKGVENCWKDQSYDYPRIRSEEEIYEILIRDAVPLPPTGSWGQPGENGDVEQDCELPTQELLAIVTRAVQQAEISGQAGTLPGGIKEILDSFLAPRIPWESTLEQFFTDLCEDDYTWKRPNRRHPDIYMPSRGSDEGKLNHLAYIIDVSGSMTSEHERRVTSEIKYIKDTLQPRKLTIVQFDTRIQDVKEYGEGDPFDSIELKGRGGTDLRCVKEWLEENQPDGAAIFTDLECPPMEEPKASTSIIWVVFKSPYQIHTPIFGKVVEIDL